MPTSPLEQSSEASPLLAPLSPCRLNGNGNNGLDDDYDDSSSPPPSDSYGLWSSIHMYSTRIWREHVGSIGTLGSVSIAVNFLTGPAMLEIPAAYQKSGLIPTTIVILGVCVVAALCSLYMASSISHIPQNAHFQKEVEYSKAFDHYFSNNKSYYNATQLCFFVCVTCLNISSLVDSAQVFDSILASMSTKGFGGGGTFALQFPSLTSRPVFVRWNYNHCTDHQIVQGICIPFSEIGDGDDDGVILTAGYLLNILCFMPLALMDLQENAAWQVVEFLVLIVTTLVFAVLFWQNGLQWEGRLSLWGDTWEDLMGVILFNFALVISIPAWLYEKQPHVDVRKVITGSSALAAALYIFLGSLGAMAMNHVSENMLQTFMSGAVMGPAMQITSCIFALFIVGLGIPLLSVLCRLNLTGSGLSQKTGDILAVYFPFGISWLLYRGDLVTKLLSWGGIIFTSLIAFIFPILLSMRALKVWSDDGKKKAKMLEEGGGIVDIHDNGVEVELEVETQLGTTTTPTTTIIEEQEEIFSGTVPVYGNWWKHPGPEGHEKALQILLVISCLSIIAAFFGKLARPSPLDLDA